MLPAKVNFFPGLGVVKICIDDAGRIIPSSKIKCMDSKWTQRLADGDGGSWIMKWSLIFETVFMHQSI